jgi:hypothetical protein
MFLNICLCRLNKTKSVRRRAMEAAQGIGLTCRDPGTLDSVIDRKRLRGRMCASVWEPFLKLMCEFNTNLALVIYLNP